jgi:hypothetical protein
MVALRVARLNRAPVRRPQRRQLRASMGPAQFEPEQPRRCSRPGGCSGGLNGSRLSSSRNSRTHVQNIEAYAELPQARIVYCVLAGRRGDHQVRAELCMGLGVCRAGTRGAGGRIPSRHAVRCRCRWWRMGFRSGSTHGGGRSSGSPSWAICAPQPLWWTARWWCPQSRTPLFWSVLPPLAQWMQWWTWHHW